MYMIYSFLITFFFFGPLLVRCWSASWFKTGPLTGPAKLIVVVIANGYLVRFVVRF